MCTTIQCSTQDILMKTFINSSTFFRNNKVFYRKLLICIRATSKWEIVQNKSKTSGKYELMKFHKSKRKNFTQTPNDLEWKFNKHELKIGNLSIHSCWISFTLKRTKWGAFWRFVYVCCVRHLNVFCFSLFVDTSEFLFVQHLPLAYMTLWLQPFYTFLLLLLL